MTGARTNKTIHRSSEKDFFREKRLILIMNALPSFCRLMDDPKREQEGKSGKRRKTRPQKRVPSPFLSFFQAVIDSSTAVAFWPVPRNQYPTKCDAKTRAQSGEHRVRRYPRADRIPLVAKQWRQGRQKKEEEGAKPCSLVRPFVTL